MHHPTVNKIIAILKEHHVWFETFEHEPVRTSAEASHVSSGYDIKQGGKAIIVKVKMSGSESKYVMLVIPGDEKFQNKKVKQAIGAKDLRFATEEEVWKVTEGVKPGGIPPFGNIFGIEVVADSKVFENDKIVFNAGDRSFSIGMTSKDYKNIVQPTVAEIC